MHKVAPAIKSAITIPFIDIFSATAAAVVKAGCSRPLLMATAYTMEQDFCLDRLREAGLSPVVPNAEDRAAIHCIIFDELCKGEVHDQVRLGNRMRLPCRAQQSTAAAVQCPSVCVCANARARDADLSRRGTEPRGLRGHRSALLNFRRCG